MSSDNWPDRADSSINHDGCIATEIKQKFSKPASTVTLVTSVITDKADKLIDSDNYSDWTRKILLEETGR